MTKKSRQNFLWMKGRRKFWEMTLFLTGNFKMFGGLKFFRFLQL